MILNLYVYINTHMYLSLYTSVHKPQRFCLHVFLYPMLYRHQLVCVYKALCKSLYRHQLFVYTDQPL